MALKIDPRVGGDTNFRQFLQEVGLWFKGKEEVALPSIWRQMLRGLFNRGVSAKVAAEALFQLRVTAHQLPALFLNAKPDEGEPT